MTQNDDTTLVVGGTGKTGRRVAQLLASRGVRLRLAARSTEPRFDWDDAATWPAVLQGIGAMYLTYQPDLAMPGAAARIAAVTRQAVATGVRRIVLLSGRGEPQVLPSEAAVQGSGAEWTILRAAWFCQNFSEGYLLDPVRMGLVAFPAGDVAEPFVDADDIADVAVAALTEDGHGGHIYDLTGPRPLTFGAAVAAIATAAGRDVRYQPISHAEYRAVLAEHVPPEVATFLGDLFAQLLDGHNAHGGDGVQRALGRPPRDFATYAREAAASGVWAS